jgi:hypothetical protein
MIFFLSYILQLFSCPTASGPSQLYLVLLCVPRTMNIIIILIIVRTVATMKHNNNNNNNSYLVEYFIFMLTQQPKGQLLNKHEQRLNQTNSYNLFFGEWPRMKATCTVRSHFFSSYSVCNVRTTVLQHQEN